MSVLTHTYPQKPQRKIKVERNAYATLLLHLSFLYWAIKYVWTKQPSAIIRLDSQLHGHMGTLEKKDAIHDAECPCRNQR